MQVARQRDCTYADRLRDGFFKAGEALSRFQNPFSFFGHLSHNLDCIQRIIACGGFLGEHERVSAVQDSVCDIRHLGAGGTGIPHHRAQHLRRRDDRLAQMIGRADHHFLHGGNALLGDFQTQVAARNHDAVDVFENAVEMVQRLVFFDLGDDRNRRAAMLHLLHLAPRVKNILTVAHE